MYPCEAPAIESVDEDYEIRQFNGTFDIDSPYKGPPSPEVDAAWDSLINGKCPNFYVESV